MADGIIGAISLGFQVTRELAVYYSAFKSYHSDVDAVATRIELVSNVFERMQATIQGLSPSQINSLKELDKLVIACVDSLRELERYKEKCAKPKHAPDLLKVQIQGVIKRLVYPFRKSTLEGMQRTLDSLIGTVQLMTQVTHIDAGKSWNHQMLLSNDQIQRDLHTVLAQQSTQVLSLNGISNQLGSTTDLILASHSMILSQLSGLESQIKTLTNTSGSTDMVLRYPARSEVTTHAREPLSSPSEDLVRNPGTSGGFLDTLQCRCPRKKYRRHYTGYIIPGVYRTKVYTHLPGCPFHFNSSVVTTIGMKIRIGLWKAAYVLETGIEYGSSYMAPHIRYRNLTEKSRSPMFRILGAFDLMILHNSASEGIFRDTLDLVSRALVTIFQQERASIYDLNEYGSNIIHVILFTLANTFHKLHSERDSLHMLNDFIQNLVCMGAEMNLVDCRGWTPLGDCLTFFPTEWSSSIVQDIPILIEMECSSSIIAKQVGWSNDFRALMKLKMLAQFSSNGIVGSPLMISLLQESQSDLQTYLKKGPLSEYETDIELLTAAVTWPDGFRQLIAHGVPLSSLDESGYSILDIAMSVKNTLDTVQYLLGLSTSLITPRTWNIANRFHTMYRNDESTQILRCIAAQLSEHYRSSRPVLFNNDTSSMLSNMYHTSYHALELTVVGAQALYDNGFTEINNEDTWGTPLLSHFSCSRVSLPTTDLALLPWFLEKSNSSDTFHTGFHGNDLHVLAQNILKSIFDDIRFGILVQKESMNHFSDARSSLADIFLDPNHDCCTCFCSTHGCDIITFTLKRNPYDHGCTISGKKMFQDYGGMSQKFVLTEVFGFLGIHLEQHLERVHSALRIMTFDRLGITHTCMQKVGYKRYYNYTIQEISDIHHAEKNDIDTLEDLLTHFESEWSNYDSTFLEFLESNWEPHMEQVLSGRRAVPMDKEVLDECNVRLIEYGPEKISEPLQPSDDMYRFTWFQRVVEAMVDGKEIKEEDRFLWG